MLALLRARCASNFHTLLQPWKLGFSSLSTTINIDGGVSKCVLDLQEIEKVLTDVKADDVKVIPVPEHCDWADYMVLATGRSTWHVKNIAQALIYKACSLVSFFSHPILYLSLSIKLCDDIWQFCLLPNSGLF